MFVATFNYDLFQRADVLCAAESPDALKPAPKDSAERGNRGYDVIGQFFILTILEKSPKTKSQFQQEILLREFIFAN